MKFYRLNQYIQASQLRVIDSEGKQIGVISKEEALAKAKQAGLDLVEIAPQANPPVAKIVEFQKFKYEENKKERGSKKSSEGSLKELWLSPRIAEHDLQVRLDRAQEFLKEGHKVKLTVKFKGREMAHPELGHEVLRQAISNLGGHISVERESRFEGRNLSVILVKSKGGKKDEQTKTEEIIPQKSEDHIQRENP